MLQDQLEQTLSKTHGYVPLEYKNRALSAIQTCIFHLFDYTFADLENDIKAAADDWAGGADDQPARRYLEDVRDVLWEIGSHESERASELLLIDARAG